MPSLKSEIFVVVMFALFIGGIAWISYQSRKQPQQKSGEASPPDQGISGESEAGEKSRAIVSEVKTRASGMDQSKHTTISGQ